MVSANDAFLYGISSVPWQCWTDGYQIPYFIKKKSSSQNEWVCSATTITTEYQIQAIFSISQQSLTDDHTKTIPQLDYQLMMTTKLEFMSVNQRQKDLTWQCSVYNCIFRSAAPYWNSSALGNLRFETSTDQSIMAFIKFNKAFANNWDRKW